MWSQRIKTLLFPIAGLDLDPPTPEGNVRIEGEVQPVLSFIAAKSVDGTVLLEGTPTGELKTAPTGSGLSLVEVTSGVATDSLTDVGLADSFTYIVIKVKNNSLSITFETSSGTYSSAVEMDVGVNSRDMGALDVQVANNFPGRPSTYEIEAYR